MEKKKIDQVQVSAIARRKEKESALGTGAAGHMASRPAGPPPSTTGSAPARAQRRSSVCHVQPPAQFLAPIPSATLPDCKAGYKTRVYSEPNRPGVCLASRDLSRRFPPRTPRQIPPAPRIAATSFHPAFQLQGPRATRLNTDQSRSPRARA